MIQQRLNFIGSTVLRDYQKENKSHTKMVGMIKLQRKWSAQVINNRGKESVGHLFQNVVEESAMNARRTVLSEGFWDSVNFQKRQIERGA